MKHLSIMACLWALPLWASAADGSDEDSYPRGSLHGDVKMFSVLVFPFAWFDPPDIPPEAEPFLPDDYDPDELVDALGLGTDAQLTGAADLRLKLDVELAPRWRLVAHQATTVQNVAGGLGATGTQAGVGLTAPELFTLTWRPDLGSSTRVQARVDRLSLKYEGRGVALEVGRQPVTLGTSLVFTPMDVVNPFTPATIDTEYKPGIDALRADLFAGVTGRATAVLAWASPQGIADPNRDGVGWQDIIGVAHGQVTVGVTDLQLMFAAARGDAVVGGAWSTSLGPVGQFGEVTWTQPSPTADEQSAFVRAASGFLGRPTGTTTLSVELSWHGCGTNDPGRYLEVASGPRFSRGEVWQMGRLYGALAWSQELTPLVSGQVAVVGNLLDPSGLVSPGLSWSISENSSLYVGGYAGLGQRPDRVQLELDPETLGVVVPETAAVASSVRSEYGLLPISVVGQIRTYF